jgi:aminoglycoside phosphotransferase (APT) family kinase protein
MSRTGLEAKLPWKCIPQAIHQQVDAALGAPVIRAERAWGGYAPTPTYRLLLANGRHAFFKGTFHASNAFSKRALQIEERVYSDLSSTLGRWMPQWYATLHHEDWHVLLLEDLGAKSVPSWTPVKTRKIAYALADFHLSSLDSQPPVWLPRPDEELERESWTRTVEESQRFRHIAALAGNESPLALEWFQKISPKIDRLMKQQTLREGPYAILHGDIRSDNLRFTRGQLYLFDWPSISVGRPEWDIVAFAQSVTVDKGPAPEQVMAWYGERFPLNNHAVDCSLAFWFTFFAARAWLPEIPELPRLRRFQRQQLSILASWAARRWSFSSPTWAEQLLS